LVQQNVPTARQGRAFGRFEAIFQLVWVLGGLVPVAISMSLRVGDLTVTVLLAAAAATYLLANRLADLRRLPSWWPGITSAPVPLTPEAPVLGGAVGLVDGGPEPGSSGPRGPIVSGPALGDALGEGPESDPGAGLARPPRLGPPPPLGGGAPPPLGGGAAAR
jgi:hypothetical protein